MLQLRQPPPPDPRIPGCQFAFRGQLPDGSVEPRAIHDVTITLHTPRCTADWAAPAQLFPLPSPRRSCLHLQLSLHGRRHRCTCSQQALRDGLQHGPASRAVLLLLPRREAGAGITQSHLAVVDSGGGRLATYHTAELEPRLEYDQYLNMAVWDSRDGWWLLLPTPDHALAFQGAWRAERRAGYSLVSGWCGVERSGGLHLPGAAAAACATPAPRRICLLCLALAPACVCATPALLCFRLGRLVQG